MRDFVTGDKKLDMLIVTVRARRYCNVEIRKALASSLSYLPYSSHLKAGRAVVVFDMLAAELVLDCSLRIANYETERMMVARSVGSG